MSFSSLSEHAQTVAGFADFVEVCKHVLNTDHVKQNTLYCAVEHLLNILAGCDVPFSPVTGDSACLPWLFKCNGEWLRTHACQVPHNPGMHLMKSQGLVYVEVSQMVLNLVFSYKGRYFISPPWSSGTWELLEVWLPAKTEAKKKSQMSKKPSHPCPRGLSLMYWGVRYTFKSSFSNQHTSRSPCFFSDPLPHSAPTVP